MRNTKIFPFFVIFFTLLFYGQNSYSQNTIVLTPQNQQNQVELSNQEKLELETKRRELLLRLLSLNDPDTLKKLLDFFVVHDVVSGNFVDSKTSAELLNLAMIGMVKGLDPYSNLFVGEDARLVSKSLFGEEEYVGVGMSVSNFSGSVVVTEVFDDSPAFKAGLEPGDILLSVDGQSVYGLSVAKIVSLIKGLAGTSVSLEIKSVRFQAPKNLTVIRDKIVVESVTYKELANNQAYIKIRTFTQETPNRFKEALNKASNKRGLIIDLRNNGGGSLDAVNQMVGFLVGPTKVLISVKGRNVESEILTPDISDTPINFPSRVAVLVNNFSASASEIMAGVFKHYQVAKVFGVRTFGKATVQNYMSLDGPDLRNSLLILGLTINRFYLPSGENITDEGVSPDVIVEQPDNFRIYEYGTKKDTQLQEAIKFLRK